MVKNYEDRRKYKRILFTPQDGIIGIFSFPGEDNEQIEAQVLNVSEGGLQLAFKPILNSRIKEGDRLLLTEIRGKTSKQVVINVDAEVKWTSEDEISENIGLGCEFHDLIGENRKEINEFVELWYLQSVGRIE